MSQLVNFTSVRFEVSLRRPGSPRRPFPENRSPFGLLFVARSPFQKKTGVAHITPISSSGGEKRTGWWGYCLCMAGDGLESENM